MSWTCCEVWSHLAEMANNSDNNKNLAELANNNNKNLAESKKGEVGAGWDLEQGEEHRGEKGNVETELPTKDVGNRAGRKEILLDVVQLCKTQMVGSSHVAHSAV